jgi:hypothetical protein
MGVEMKRFGRLTSASSPEGALEGTAELEEAAETLPKRLTPWEFIEEAAPKVLKVIERDVK